MSDLKAKVGQPVTADKWNRIVDRLPSTTAGNPAGGFAMSRVECLIKNSSGADRDIGELLSISGFDGPDGSNIYEVAKHAVYTAINPGWHGSINRIVVLAEPIPDGEYGRAVISGQCIVKITAGSGTDPYVMIDASSVNECRGSTGGMGRLLCVFDQPGYCMVNWRDGSNLWRYELTQDSQAPLGTTAKLLRLDGFLYADEIGLLDPQSLMDDQVDGDGGLCVHTGNTFTAIQGPCS